MSKKLFAVILASALLLSACNSQGESKTDSSNADETTKVETSTDENSSVKPLIKYNGAVYEMQEIENEEEKLTEIPKDKGLALDAKVEKTVANETSDEDLAKEDDLTARNMPLGTLIYANEDKDTIYVSYLDPEDFHVSLYAIFIKVK
ncbi:hypothetical protein [Fastidiosipila sanguinis]|uniref:Lipoprotein n=1 Tax=Fastidiosipila sanguinis TaxID=236753 RepID=A0A2S0KPJ7_9FIRM|nr:hypothetical protein [Fastidiosipila sanguinis]AVM42937.1 hypothetical protein C5Q98_06815 [Fastidiosipila sanguinis]